jgi:MFS family permease
MLNVEGGDSVRQVPLTTRGRRLVLAAAGVSSLGDGMWTAAVPLTAAMFDRTPSAVAAVSAAGLLPWLVVSPVAGALVDRWPRRRVLVGGDAIRAVIIGLLAVALIANLASVPILAIGAFLVVSGWIFHGAAQQALIADLTDDDPVGRDRMNGQMSSLEVGGASLVGPPLGSAAYSVASWIPYLGDAISFLFSAVCLATLPTREHRTVRPTDSVRMAMRTGAAFLLHHAELRTLALLTGAANFTTNCALVVLVLYATDPGGLGLSDASYGLLIAALALGGVVAGPVAPRLLHRFGDHAVVVIALGVRSLVWPIVAVAGQPVVVAIALAAAGFASTCVTVTVTSARQRLSPRDMLGRVVTAFRTLGNGAAPLGAVVGGAIATVVGLRASLVAAGGLLALALVLALPFFLRSRRPR